MLVTYAARAASATRALFSASWIFGVSGCASPNTRVHTRATDSSVATLKMRWLYAISLYPNDRATLADLREAVETLESVAPLWKRVFGPLHPETQYVQNALKDARETLAARAAASSSGA